MITVSTQLNASALKEMNKGLKIACWIVAILFGTAALDAAKKAIR